MSRGSETHKKRILACGLLLLLLAGCALREIRSKAKVGPEFVHRGSVSTNSERWMVEQGLEVRWEGGVTTGLTYRRRDINDGNGDNENRVLFEFSFPLWKAESPDAGLAYRLGRLQTRLERLERQVPGGE